MWFCSIFILTLSSQYVVGQFGPFKQAFNYVNVREGAHMFYWLFYTTATENYTERPLIVWLQGGPGGSSTGIGNFEILGPQDVYLQERNYTWVNNFNVLFVDNPVGTGYSYVEDLKFLTVTNDEIALDFVALMRGFYENHPEFNSVPLYIYGQSYGGKMAIDMAIRMREAEQEGTIGSNLKGVAMGNAWISPVDATLTWGPLLLAAGLVDQEGHDAIQAAAEEAERLFNAGDYVGSTAQWANTQGAVFQHTTSVDFYNILTKMQVGLSDTTRSAYELSREMLIDNIPYASQGKARQEVINLNHFMNNDVRQALNIPDHVTWGNQSNAVFNYLRGDFMKPVTDGIEKLLNETDIILTKYNGNLDLICDTPGQLLWVDRLKWHGAEAYKQAPRLPIWENELQGEGIGDLTYTAALTRIHDHGDMFWWFYPTVAAAGTTRPLILWLDGVTGVPPSLSANLGMFGPYDMNFNTRENSWVDQYNLLFIDAPLGTGFSTPLSKEEIPKTIEENAAHLATTLNSFYSVHKSYRNAPLYIFGQGYGAQLALALAIEAQNHRRLNPRGVVIANGIISPAVTMSKLGFYLEELGYIADNGRPAIETLAKDINDLVSVENYSNAFDVFASLGEFVNEKAGAIAVNLAYIVEKKTQETSDSRGQLEWVNNLKWSGQDEFKNSPRRTLIVNSLVEGYFRETPRLKFYWMNAAGQSVPLDSPSAINVVLGRITAN
ncbi:unnamed protein product [Chrysodeixis includens]|uniref:Retinoid-inducible serine carboxypeptidase n=1 Tax=Chrysodeixis includens TaxID=689277 RepID=A0A9N8L1N8_CHRIL|nr:unnamed protein product [Chrysodeixis includens]